MAPQLGLVLFSLLTTDDSIERDLVTPPPVVRIDVPLATAANSINGESSGWAYGCGRGSYAAAESVDVRLLRAGDTPWTSEEFTRVLRAGYESSDHGPRVSVVLLNADGGYRIGAVETVAIGPDFRCRIRTPSKHDGRFELAIDVEGMRIAVSPWSPGQRSVDLRYEPASFPGFAKSVEFVLVGDDGSKINFDTRARTKPIGPGTRPSVEESITFTCVNEEPAKARTDWVVAGRRHILVAGRAGRFLDGAAEYRLPACDSAEVTLRVVRPVSLRLIAAPEDRLRLFRAKSIQLVDERGFEHRLDAYDERSFLDPSHPNFEMLVAHHPHKYFGAPRGPLSLVIDSNVIPIHVASYPQWIHLPRLAATREGVLRVGPFDVGNAPPDHVEVRVFTMAGIRVGLKLESRSTRSVHRVDREWMEIPTTLVPGFYRFEARVNGALRRIDHLTVEDRDEFEVKLHLDR